MEMLFWQPSPALRVLSGVRGVIGLGVCYLMVFLFFPHVLLVLVVSAAALVPAAVFIPGRVTLDLRLGEVTIRLGWWTRRIPLTEIESVDQVFRLGAEIRLRKGTTYSFSPFRKPRRRLARWLHIRTGFEGMELAITQAVAAAREVAALDAAVSEDAPAGFLAGILACGAGLAAIGMILLIHPQVDVPAVHVAAVLLAIWYALGATVALLIGISIVLSRVRRARTR